MLDWQLMTSAIAAQEPWWEPGTAHGYHVNTFGFAVGEVLRRASGRTVGTLLREEVAGPLRADVHIGLPAAEHARVAEFAWPAVPPAEAERPGLDDDQLMEYNAYFNPSGLSGAGVLNTPGWRRALHMPVTGPAQFPGQLGRSGNSRRGAGQQRAARDGVENSRHPGPRPARRAHAGDRSAGRHRAPPPGTGMRDLMPAPRRDRCRRLVGMLTG